VTDHIEAIKQLKARYCRTMDTKDWTAMRQVFTDDVTMDTVASGGNVMTGADDFLTFLVGTIGEVHHRPPVSYSRDRTHLRDDRGRHLGDGGHATVSGRLGVARLWPLPRDTCGTEGRMAHWHIDADPSSDGLHTRTGAVTVAPAS
jgi:SnoaL-like domain